jgi:hypothetical protein
VGDAGLVLVEDQTWGASQSASRAWTRSASLPGMAEHEKIVGVPDQHR